MLYISQLYIYIKSLDKKQFKEKITIPEHPNKMRSIESKLCGAISMTDYYDQWLYDDEDERDVVELLLDWIQILQPQDLECVFNSHEIMELLSPAGSAASLLGEGVIHI